MTIKLCSVDGCGNGSRARGLCPGHYARLRSHGDVMAGIPLSENQGQALKFLRSAIVAPGDDCIQWPFYLSDNGYGLVFYQGEMVRAHRLALALSDGIKMLTRRCVMTSATVLF